MTKAQGFGHDFFILAWSDIASTSLAFMFVEDASILVMYKYLLIQGVSPKEAKPTASGSPTASPRAAKASTDANTNYAPVVGGIVGAVALAYWYSKKFLFFNDDKTVHALNRQV